MTDLLVPIAVGWAAIFAPLAGWLARDLGRPVPAWVAFGAILGPIAAALLVVAPPARCPACDASIVGWGPRCSFCGADARVREAASDEPVTAVPAEEAPPPAPSRPAPAPLPAPAAGASPLRRLDGSVGPGPASSGPSPAAAAKPAPAPVRPAPVPAVSAPAAAAPPARDLAAAAQGGGPSAGTVAPDAGAAGAPAAEREILATAVFLGGDRALVAGERYVLAIYMEQLEILGPVTTTPQRTALARPAAQLDVLGHGGRLIMTARTGGSRAFLVVFDRLAGADALAIEARLGALGASTAGPGSEIAEAR